MVNCFVTEKPVCGFSRTLEMLEALWGTGYAAYYIGQGEEADMVG